MAGVPIDKIANGSSKAAAAAGGAQAAAKTGASSVASKGASAAAKDVGTPKPKATEGSSLDPLKDKGGKGLEDNKLTDNKNEGTKSSANKEEGQKAVDENGEPLEPGTKLGDGKTVNEKGEVQENTSKKVVKGVATGAAAYFGGAKGAEAARAIENNQTVDKALGKISDQFEKSAVGGAVTKAAEEEGLGELADGVNNAVDVMTKAKSGDIKGTVDSAKELAKNAKGFKEKQQKAMLKKIALACLPGLLSLLFFAVIAAPILGGVMDMVESIEEFFQSVEDFFSSDSNFSTDVSEDEQRQVEEILSKIPDYENLSETRKNMLAAAALAAVKQIKYNKGGHPTGAGLEGIPNEGLDCAGFVQWVLMTGTGTYNTRLTTGTISSKIGTDFILIDESELQPGDIGLKFIGASDYDNGHINHTGIYAGDGYWIDDSSSLGVSRNTTRVFKYYVRYVGADD